MRDFLMLLGILPIPRPSKTERASALSVLPSKEYVYWCGNCENFSEQPCACDRCGWNGELNPVVKKYIKNGRA